MNNEERILEMLEALTEKVDKQGEQLAAQGAQLNAQGAQLAKHSEQLDRLDEQMAKRGEQLDRLDEQMAKRGEQLDRLEVQVTKHSEQLDRLEDRVDELDSRSLRSAVLLETEVAKKIQLVYEGQELLRQKMDGLVTKDRFEVLEDEVITLKTAVKSMSKRLTALEKAQ